MFVPEMTYREVWTFPVTGPDGPDGPDSAPENVLDACLAVGRDLQCRWDGPDTYTQNCVWTVSLLDTGYCHVALRPDRRPRHKTAGTSPLRAFGFGGPHIEQPTQELTVLIAGETQDQLAGGMPFVLWPIEEQRLLMPLIRDGRAVWVARSSDRVVAAIGALWSI